jgi:hypothetical protein
MHAQPDAAILPMIDAPSTHTAVLRAALNALALEPWIYAHRGRLVRIATEPHPHVVPLNGAMVTEALWASQPWNAYLEQHGMKFPKWIVGHLMKRTEWPNIRELADVIDTPLLLSDGRLLHTPGYDAKSRYFLLPRVDLALSERPSVDDARAALKTLDKLASHFPFETLAHRSAFVAALVTPFARETFGGSAPLFFLDTPFGALHTMLADVIAHVSTGQDIIHMDKPPSERSFRRRVSQANLQGHHLILLDDADAFRGARGIRTALLTREWVDGDARTRDTRPITWLAASDNTRVNHDVTPLVLPIRTHATHDLVLGPIWSLPLATEEVIKRDRPRFVQAALTLLRAFDQAGRPDQLGDAWPEFRDWTRTVASAVVWAGGVNPLLARRDVSDSLEEDPGNLFAFFQTFLDLNPGERGITIGDLLDRLEKRPPELEPLREALDNLAPNGWHNARKLGALFKRIQRQPVEGLVFERAGEDRKRYARWTVRPSAESLQRCEPVPSQEEQPIPAVTSAEETPMPTAESPAPIHAMPIHAMPIAPIGDRRVTPSQPTQRNEPIDTTQQRAA